jgi:hypothetical protein
MMINGTRIKRDDENKRREIEGIVDEALIEKANRVNKNANSRHNESQ